MINILKSNNITVQLIKVPAHTGITGNELADYWAKYGALELNKMNLILVLYQVMKYH